MVRAITFDFWATLYQDFWAREARLEILAEVLRQAGRPRTPEELAAAYRHGWDLFEQVWKKERRSIDLPTWLRAVLDFLQTGLPEETLLRLRRPLEEVYLRPDSAGPQPVPGVAEVLPRLARRYPLGLISDVGLTPGRVLRQVLQRDGLLRHFTALTFSDEIGVTKPAPEPFLRTARLLGVPPEAVVHIGDLPETDIQGAREVGMRTILFLGVSRREDGRPLADAVLEEYGQLEHLLADLDRERR